jgi:hypothetical protein
MSHVQIVKWFFKNNPGPWPYKSLHLSHHSTNPERLERSHKKTHIMPEVFSQLH